ncbi:MAG: ribokinase [bacterium]|nr:ribokinase [bacterium]
MTHFDVIGIGVNAVDILLRMPPNVQAGRKYEVENLVIQGGGNAGTATCVCSSLGWRAAYVAKMGENTVSQIARVEYQKRGVLPDFFIDVPSARPCIAMVQIDPQTAERTIFYNRDAYPPLFPSDLPLASIQNARVLILDDNEPDAVETALKAVEGTACRSVLDLEKGDPQILRRLLALGTDAILPMALARTLSGKKTPEDVLQELAGMTKAQLAVTDGTSGSWALTPEGIIHQKAFQVEAVDTTGCGDVFHGAYAAGLLEGMGLVECLEFAAWMSSIAACQMGGRRALPTRKELADLDRSRLTEPLKACLARMVY